MTAEAERTGPVTISRELFDFLMGAGGIDGVHFGEEKGDPPGRFWWRQELRAADVADIAEQSALLPDVLSGQWTTPEGRQMAQRCLAETRDQLSMASVSDMELANRIFLADRCSLEMIGLQAAAKERIRWLSAQLAYRNGMVADVNAAIEPVRHWYETIDHQIRYVVDVVRDMAFDIQADRKLLIAMRAALLAQDAAEARRDGCPTCARLCACIPCAQAFTRAAELRRAALSTLDEDAARYLAMLDLSTREPAEAQT